MKIKIPALFLHKRTKVQNSNRAYLAVLRIWQIVLLSYLLDAAIVLYTSSETLSFTIIKSFLDYFSPLLIIIFCVLSISVCAAINRVKSGNDNKSLNLNKNIISSFTYAKYLIPIVIVSVLLLLSSSLSQSKESMFVTFGGTFVIAIALISTSLKSYSNLLDLIQKKPRNIFLQIYPDAVRRCIFVSIGLLSARAIGVIAIVSYSNNRFSDIYFILFEIISLLLLFSCKPRVTYFQNTCPTCRSKRSVAMGHFPKCPACYSRIFYL